MTQYIGRFAPSPTGPLHFGSLLAAVVSYLDAKSHHGKWLLRIEDVDPPRESLEAKESILHCLESHGLNHDDEVLYQSTQSEYYESLLGTLKDEGHVFYCPCSRKYLESHHNKHSKDCSLQKVAPDESAIKFRANGSMYSWRDGFEGEQALSLTTDFVLKRKDKLYSYQLAVVADDIYQKVNHVVRGVDLLDSTAMQLAIYEALKESPPEFSHFPVVVGPDGEKLSKQNLAKPVDPDKAVQNLSLVMRMLKLDLPEQAKLNPQKILEYSVSLWQARPLMQKHAFSLPK